MEDKLKNYCRIGADYFKQIQKIDQYGIKRLELKKWKKEEITQDFGRNAFGNIKKYNDFIIEPSNTNYSESICGCYNLYHKFSYIPKKGDWKWTKILMEHVFGDQYELGIKYMQALYMYPKKHLPILCLISKERMTGKSTFIDYLTGMFGKNMNIINPDNLKSGFNYIIATSNIIAIEEAVVDKSHIVQKIKSLSTQKTITVNIKFIPEFSSPLFPHFIMASNDENLFIRIEDEEIRFFIRKLSKPKFKNHNILEDVIREIPAFLHYLTTLEKLSWKESRQLFTAKELDNNYLRNVKEESKNWLYKEMKELFTEFFENTAATDNIMLATPIDIKTKFFNKNNQIQLSFIKKTLKEDFKFLNTDKVIRYKPFYHELEKTGKPYKIALNRFTNNNIIDEDLPF